jgi:hypothetical protein
LLLSLSVCRRDHIKNKIKIKHLINEWIDIVAFEKEERVTSYYWILCLLI